MLNVILIIAPLFLIIFASAFFTRLKIADEKWISVLNDFAFRVGLPALIFISISKTTLKFSEQLNVLLANSALILSSFLIVFLFCKLTGINKKFLRTLFICLTFANVAYLGIPVLTNVKGDAVLPTVSLIVAIYTFWMFTVGVAFLGYTQNAKVKTSLKKIFLKLIKNPLLIAIILGIFVSILEIKLPAILTQSLGMISASVTPIVLVVIGLFLGTNKIGKLKEWGVVLVFSLITLFLVPSILYFGVKFLGLQPSAFSSSIIEAAMPLAITPFAIAHEYDLDKTFIARSIVLSTVLSALTLPFWISLV